MILSGLEKGKYYYIVDSNVDRCQSGFQIVKARYSGINGSGELVFHTSDPTTFGFLTYVEPWEIEHMVFEANNELAAFIKLFIRR